MHGSANTIVDIKFSIYKILLIQYKKIKKYYDIKI